MQNSGSLIWLLLNASPVTVRKTVVFRCNYIMNVNIIFTFVMYQSLFRLSLIRSLINRF